MIRHHILGSDAGEGFAALAQAVDDDALCISDVGGAGHLAGHEAHLLWPWRAGQWLAEAIATFGLLLTIFGCLSGARAATPYAVGLYITAAYWFTASTSFANPAVTVARSLSDTFAGIAPGGVVAFILAQLAGAIAATLLATWFWPKREA